MSKAHGQDILLDTALGSPIGNAQASYIIYPVAAQELVDRIKFPSILRSLPNPRYNCHGLSFGSRRTSIHEDADVSRILKEDGYKRIDLHDVLPGDIAIYFTDTGTIDHSAIVISKPESPCWTPFVCSKWGVIGPEVIHLATKCDYAILDIRYYRIYI